MLYEGEEAFAAEDVVLLAYPWLEPIKEQPVKTYELEGGALKTKGGVVADPTASGKEALRISPADNLYNATVVWGPYDELGPGKYRVSFVMRAEGASSSSKPVVKVEVSAAPAGTTPPKTITSKVYAGMAMSPSYRDYTLDFQLTTKSACEFKVTYLGSAVLYADQIKLYRTEEE